MEGPLSGAFGERTLHLILIPKNQGLQNVTSDLGVFFKPPDGVRMPLLPEGDVYAHSMSFGHDLISESRPYAI